MAVQVRVIAPVPAQTSPMVLTSLKDTVTESLSVAVPEPFMVIATQNPIEQEGTYRLPEAQLDRFLMKVLVTYPTMDEEVEILRRHHANGGPPDLAIRKPLLTAEDVTTLRAAVRSTTVEESILKYIASMVQATRINSSLDLGASPRASIGMLASSKARAVLQGRDFVIPDDVQSVAHPVLRHRIALTPEREMDGLVPDDVIGHLVSTIDVPR